ncbi:Tryptophan 2,3-dioxygenase [Aphelenchoides fujianensis]|nr:Tryptophan 2,3-dioxygenase [Aphelenchoides fujianensis]
MSCPMGYGVRFQGGADVVEAEENDHTQQGTNKAKNSNSVSYHDYLHLEKLLNAQHLRSEAMGQQAAPDEHLFIITHQTYELWFKQIIYDIDHVRNLLNHKFVDETKTLQIVSLLERTVRILKLLVDQMLILETMSPLDFVEFRTYLTSASGFQSMQFRLLENKLGVVSNNRVKYNAQHYLNVFNRPGDLQRIIDSEEEPSLFVLIDRWLSRTPGIYEDEVSDDEDEADQQENKRPEDEKPATTSAVKTTVEVVVEPAPAVAQDAAKEPIKSEDSDSDAQSISPSARARKNFWNRYLEAVSRYLSDLQGGIETQAGDDENERKQMEEEFVKTKRSFDSITQEDQYAIFLVKGERRLSHNALKGALMIYFYRNMPRFSQPYQILTFLMDIDSLLQKWRYNHVMLVQRMLGSKQGTGGSSGYLYLRTTVSDRYKVFLDLFNLSTWLIPRDYIPKLSPRMVKTLSEHSNLKAHAYR